MLILRLATSSHLTEQRASERARKQLRQLVKGRTDRARAGAGRKSITHLCIMNGCIFQVLPTLNVPASMCESEHVPSFTRLAKAARAHSLGLELSSSLVMIAGSHGYNYATSTNMSRQIDGQLCPRLQSPPSTFRKQSRCLSTPAASKVSSGTASPKATSKPFPSPAIAHM